MNSRNMSVYTLLPSEDKDLTSGVTLTSEDRAFSYKSVLLFLGTDTPDLALG